MLLAHSTHALARQAAVAVAELRAHAFVALPHPERGGLSHRVAELCRAHGFTPQAAAVRSRKWSQLALVQANLGVAVVPASMAAHAPADVRALPLASADCTSEVLGVWRRHPAPQAQHLVTALRAAFAPKPQ